MEGAPGDHPLEVGADHGAELLTPDLEEDRVKRLGGLAVGFGHEDLSVRPAGEQGDRDIRELSQAQRTQSAPAMQRDYPIGHCLVVDANLRSRQALIGQLRGQIGQKHQRARMSGGLAGESVEQPQGVGLRELGVVQGPASHDGRPAVARRHVVGWTVQEQQVRVLSL
jgi:hypothetical protein